MSARRPACTSAAVALPGGRPLLSALRCTASSGERADTAAIASAGKAPHGTSALPAAGGGAPSTSIASARPAPAPSSSGSSGRESRSSHWPRGHLRRCAMHSAAAEKAPAKPPSTPRGEMRWIRLR
eukprot:7167157-Prymnesium_polylepis.1